MLSTLNEPNANIDASNTSARIVDLSAPGVAKLVAKRISNDIDAYCIRTYNDGHRKHLGASLIGRDCKRYLWYVFRWAHAEFFDGRKLRLFNRGHREEDRFVEWLRGAGFKVWTHDESKPMKPDGTYPQFRVSGVKGHFGGSLDGIAQFPESYGIAEPVLLEFKTNGTGKSFNDVCSTGMAVSKPDHFAQTSTYGADPNYKFRFVIYMNINKNDDTLHIEVTALDWNLGEQMKLKAEQVILSQTPPPRLADNPTYYKCKGCAMTGICHEQQAAEVNCRSCKHATPIENGEWLCTLPAHNDGRGAIPDEVIKIGCHSYEDITLEMPV